MILLDILSFEVGPSFSIFQKEYLEFFKLKTSFSNRFKEEYLILMLKFSLMILRVRSASSWKITDKIRSFNSASEVFLREQSKKFIKNFIKSYGLCITALLYLHPLL